MYCAKIQDAMPKAINQPIDKQEGKVENVPEVAPVGVPAVTVSLIPEAENKERKGTNVRPIIRK